eukprot:m.252548 g.252548  ORF g.252548 m.252548 type:complete len:179 (-) comp26708_c1_seq13:131-667(-)
MIEFVKKSKNSSRKSKRVVEALVRMTKTIDTRVIVGMMMTDAAEAETLTMIDEVTGVIVVIMMIAEVEAAETITMTALQDAAAVEEAVIMMTITLVGAEAETVIAKVVTGKLTTKNFSHRVQGKESCAKDQCSAETIFVVQWPRKKREKTKKKTKCLEKKRTKKGKNFELQYLVAKPS